MEIHKPKPWHGAREFLKELGTIVLGILIALGLEQTVASFHERRLARDAQDAIHQEMQADLTRIAYRARQQPCVDKRLEEIQALLANWHGDDAFAPGLSIGNTGYATLIDQRWQANLASGRFSEQSPQEQADQAAVYTSIHVLDHIGDMEAQTWNDMSMVELGSRSLPPEARAALAADVARARRLGEGFTKVANELLTGPFSPIVKRAGLRPDARYTPAIVATVCQPMRLSPSKGV